jgi:phosphate transport system protein
MPRKSFDQSLQQLHDEVLMLGSRVKQAILASVEALKQRDLVSARHIIGQDALINEKRFEIESATLTLIATQQPLAGDLRSLAAVLEIVTELERMGDYAKGIAKISLMIGDEPLIKPLVDIPEMAHLATSQLDLALSAFDERNLEAARTIPLEDDRLDALYDQVYRDLIDLIVSDTTKLSQATKLLWVAHNLERAGDRVTNICERVIFTITGEMKEFDGEDGSQEMHQI